MKGEFEVQCVHLTHTPPPCLPFPSFLFCVFPLCAFVQTVFLHFVSEVGVICQLGRYVSSRRMSQPPTMAHTHRYTLHAWKQPVLSVWSKLPPLWLECSWRDRREEKRRSARGAISYTFTETTGRSITNTCPCTPALTSHISCLAPACSTPQTGEKKRLKFVFISVRQMHKNSNQVATSSRQTGSDWSIKRLESRWPMQGCCSTSFIINSLCVLIVYSSGGETEESWCLRQLQYIILLLSCFLSGGALRRLREDAGGAACYFDMSGC